MEKAVFILQRALKVSHFDSTIVINPSKNILELAITMIDSGFAEKNNE